VKGTEKPIETGKIIFVDHGITAKQVVDHVVPVCDPQRKYHEKAAEIATIVSEKQVAYGDSFSRAGNCLREMYPDGIKPSKYDDMLTVVRILDKLFRVANQKEAFGESPYADICGYALLEVTKCAEL